MKRLLQACIVAALSFYTICCTSQGSSSQQGASQSPVVEKRESLALFPFTGSNLEDGEAIVSSLARQRVLRDAFERVTPITRSSIAALAFERNFQQDFNLTDPDSIFELGKELKASYVMAGYITNLGNQRLVVVSILDVESLQQIAGDYKPYNNIGEIDSLIPDMAQKLAATVLRDTSNLPGLSVPPFNVSRGVNQNDAVTLAQMLSCDLANAGKFAVLPRTDSLEFVLAEHNRQRTGENVNLERVKRLGQGRNAQYVLSGSVQWLENVNKIATDILHIEDGSLYDAYEEPYAGLSQGIELMAKIAAILSGTVDKINFIRVEGGTFRMGSESNEKPVHAVTVKSFNMGKFPVTQKEWFEVMKNNPSNFKGDNLPVENITWLEAIEYCNRRSLLEGLTPAYRGSGGRMTCDWNANGYRLPTEAEWEYAAKGGNKDQMEFTYSGSNSVDPVAWYKDNSEGSTKPVGTKAPNSLGLYDMSGNVWEWCWDWYGSYSSSPQTDPRGPDTGSYRVLRGGSWFNSAHIVRSANRGSNTPSGRSNDLGFRLVRP